MSRENIWQLPGVDPEASKNIQTLIETLQEADAVVTLAVFTLPSDKTHEVGWMVPFEVDGTQAFALIDAYGFNTSIHFIRQTALRHYDEEDKDDFLPGKTQYLNSNYENAQHLHVGGVRVPYEDKTLRLLPSNPEHSEKINKLLSIALEQTREKIAKSMSALDENRKNTTNTFVDFLKGLQDQK